MTRRLPTLTGLLALGCVLAVAGACVPALSGAPCTSDQNCPSGQFCGSEGKCLPAGTPDPGIDGGGAGGAGGGSGGGAGGGAGGGTGGGTGGGGGGTTTCNGVQVDLNTDPSNCGACDNLCPVPSHAAVSCAAGKCGRGLCAAGFFDIDGAATLGCEATCAGKVCTLPDGGTVTVTNDPLPETGLFGRAFVNGSSVGGGVQTNPTHSNLGSIGEATPAAGGGLEVGNSTHRHRGGFGALVK